MWLPCRHHIAELLVGAAWYEIFDKDMAPYIKQFKDFQASWDSIDKKKFVKLQINESLQSRANEIIDFCKAQLASNKKFARGDYKESLELVLVCLGCSIPTTFTFKKPGALHKARFMAKILYGLKIFLFRFELNRNQAEQQKLQRFTTFICLFYIKHWFKAPIAVDAPKTDLELYHDMFQYKTYDSKVANAVLKKFYGHTWYLNQEFLPLCLFSTIVSNEEKQEIAQKILSIAPPEEYEGIVEFDFIEVILYISDQTFHYRWCSRNSPTTITFQKTSLSIQVVRLRNEWIPLHF